MADVLGTGGAAAPVSGPSTGGSLMDSLVGDALAGMEADGELEAQEGAEGAEPTEDPGEGEEGQEDGTEELEEGEEGEEDERATSKGSKSDPWTVKDLPEDRFVKIKVDGVEESVSMREMADGYIRLETFTKRVNGAQTAVTQAENAVKELKETHGTTRAAVNQLLGDPKQLLDFYLRDAENEGIFRAAATEFAKLHSKWKANPQERAAWERERDSGRLKAERDAFEKQKQTDTQSREQREHSERRQRELRPGYEAGLAASGFPRERVDAEFQLEIKAYLHAVSQRTGKPATAEDMKQAVIRTAKLLGTQPGAPKPKPAAITPKTKPKGEGRAQGKPIKKGSVEWFMKDLKPMRG